MNLKYTILFLIVFISFNDAYSQIAYIDSLTEILSKTDNQYKKLDAYFKITEHYNYKDPLKALPFAKEALQLAEQLDNTKNLYFAYKNMGNSYYFLSDYDKASEMYLRMLELSKEKNDSAGMAAALNNMGITLNEFEDYYGAIDYLSQAIEIFKQYKNYAKLWRCYANIGLVYHNLEEYEQALEYYNLSETTWMLINEEKNYKFADIQNYIGSLYRAKNLPDSAKKYYYNALYYYEKEQNYYSAANTYNNLVKLMIDNNLYDRVKQLAIKSLEYSKKTGALKTEVESYNHLAKYYEKINLSDSALKYYKKYILLYDSLRKQTSLKEKEYIKEIYLLEKKEANERLYQNEILLNKNKVMQRNILIYSLLGVFIVSLFFIIQLTRINKKRKKYQNKLVNHKKIITEKNHELTLQKDELSAQSEELLAMTEELEKLSIVASYTDNVVVIIDRQGKIEWINESFRKTYQYKNIDYENITSKNINEISMNPQINALLSKCNETKKSEIYSFYIYDNKGKKNWYQTTLTPIIDTKGNVNNFITIDTDITKIKKAEQKIRIINEQINSSIRYAHSIQLTILPKRTEWKLCFDSFLIYLPKDIVSGDFYWYYRKEFQSKIYHYIAVVDCTGHGVPGAFMSLIGSRLLNEIVKNDVPKNTCEILNELDSLIIKTLRQKENDGADGMDMVLCRIEKNSKDYNVQFSGAKNKLIISSGNKINSVRTNRASIGGLYLTKKRPYTSINLTLNRNDIIYLLSDGIIDQNNKFRKRFGTTQLVELLEKIADKDLTTQEKEINIALNRWMEDEPQRDDITILALKMK